MSELLKKEREVVLPGDKIIESMDYLPGRNCFREGESIYSKRLGIVSVRGRVISVVPLSGVYVPKPGDMVIGEVIDIQSNGWVVDINGVHEAYIPLSGVREYVDTSRTDLSKIYSIGDVIYAKISLASRNTVHLTMQDPKAKKFRGGMIMKMSSAKVPRLIGKNASMINMIKEKTGCRISVGQNGLIWVEGENVPLVKKAVEMIERESISEGLTERVSEMLDKELAGSDAGQKGKPEGGDDKNEKKG